MTTEFGMPIILDNGVELRLIPDSPNDDYMAGTDGNVYSRTRYKGFGRKEYVDWYPLKGHVDKRKGYRRISLCHDNVKVTKTVHSLICAAFHGPAPSRVHQVRHLDGVPANCKPGNLEWGTQIENWKDREAHGRGIKGEKHHESKFTNQERAHIKWAVQKRLCSMRDAARILGVSFTAIRGICHGAWDS